MGWFLLGYKSQFEMTVFCFLLLSDAKKTMFYVLHSKPKLVYIFSVLISIIESEDVPYLSRVLVRDTLSSCIVDRSSHYIPN
jgi:hypothetical protein